MIARKEVCVGLQFKTYKKIIMTGTVKTKTDKGFGFISREGEEKDLFFHSSDLVGISFEELQQGATVEFNVEEGDRGLSAKNVKVV